MRCLIAVFAVALTFASSALAQSSAKTMHDTYCVACHGTEVYTREEPLARDYSSVRAQVERWQAYIGLDWSDAEIEMMTNWLAERYYRLSCPHDC